MAGTALIASAIAQAMTWVKETLPPRERVKELFMKIRFSIKSAPGTVLTLVAVGTVKLDSMFVTTRLAAPVSAVVSVSMLAGPVTTADGAFKAVGGVSDAVDAVGPTAGSGVILGGKVATTA